MKKLALFLTMVIAAMTMTVFASAAEGDRVQNFTLSGGGSTAAEPAQPKGISHKKILKIAKEVAEEIGLEWLDAPTESFDPATTVDGRTAKEMREYFRNTFSQYKEGGYDAVYAKITNGRYGGNVLVLYQG